MRRTLRFEPAGRFLDLADAAGCDGRDERGLGVRRMPRPAKITKPKILMSTKSQAYRVQHNAKIKKNQIMLGDFNVAVAEFYDGSQSAADDIKKMCESHDSLLASLAALVAESDCAALPPGERCARVRCPACDARALLEGKA